MAEENVNTKQAWMKYEKLLKKEGNKADGDPSKGLAFALNFDPSPKGEHVFYTHKTKKNQDKLGKEARGDGKGNKAAFGRMYMDGSTVVFKCDRSIPGMPRSIKLFFKSLKLKKKAQIIDEDGVSTDVEAEEDETAVEETGRATTAEAPADEAPETTRAQSEAPAETAEPGMRAEAPAEDAEADAGDQASAQRGRLSDVERMITRWVSKDTDAQNALNEARQMIEGNDADAADRKITEIEARLDAIGDPAKIVERAQELKARIGEPSDDRGRKLTDAVRMAAKLMSNKTIGDYERAAGMLDKIGEAAERIMGQATPETAGAEAGGADAEKREAIMTKIRDLGKEVDDLMKRAGLT